MTADAQASFAATITDEWVRSGVTDAVICPGSRSTPVALCLMGDGRIRIHVVLDERSAGFVALGIGLATGRPAVVLTTSGTAAVELHPAVVEAHQAGVPLIAVTADRPADLHGIGAPQTVDQIGLFGGSVRLALNPGVVTDESRWAWRSLASRTVAAAGGGEGGRPGPVHLNLAFREPLTGGEARVEPGRRGDRAWHEWMAAPATGANPGLARDIAGAQRGLIVAGGGADAEAVLALASTLGWPVLADPRSGARVPSPATVAAADAILRVAAFAGAALPDLVLRVGEPPASRVVNEWLAALDAPQVLIDPHGRWADPGRRAAVVTDGRLGALATAVSALDPRPADPAWLGRWRAADDAAQAAFDATLARHLEVTEPGVARSLMASLPDGADLVVSSSMPIRDVEWFAAPRSGVRVLANRGANGIDGVLSTAVGAAASSPRPTYALLGDLAFLHDVNALLSARGTSTGVDLVVVVVDNDGGGIFSFLPQRHQVAQPRFERLFATPHGLNLRTVAASFGVEAERVTAAADLVPTVAKAAGAGGVRMVHVRTDRDANVAVHAELNAAVDTAVQRLAV